MSAFSNYLELKIAQWTTNAVAMGAAPAALYIGLFSSDPTEAGTGGTEVTNTLRGNPTRPTIPLTAATVSDVTTLKNPAQFVFVSVATAGATISHFAIFDAATGTTNMLYKGVINNGVSKAVTAGDEVRFNENQFVITID